KRAWRLAAPRPGIRPQGARQGARQLGQARRGRARVPSRRKALERLDPGLGPALDLIAPVPPRERVVRVRQVLAADSFPRQPILPALRGSDEILELLRGEVVAAQDEKHLPAEIAQPPLHPLQERDLSLRGAGAARA